MLDMTKVLRMRWRSHCYSMIMLFLLVTSAFDGFSQTFPFLLKFSSAGDIGQIAIDSRQRIFVTDGAFNKIRMFTKDGVFVNLVGAGRFTAIGGIAFDKDDNLYVSDGTTVKVFDVDGNYLRQMNAGNAGAVAINKTTGVLYVVNSQTNMVEARDITTGALEYSFPGVGPIVVDAFGSVIVNNGAQGLSTYDETGNISFTSNLGYDIKGLAGDNAGNLFVTKNDISNFAVEVYDPVRTHQTSIGAASAGSADGQFNSARHMAVDNVGGRLIVADNGNFRIQVFTMPQFVISNFNDITKNYSDIQFTASATSTPSGNITYTFLPGSTGNVNIFGPNIQLTQAGTVKLRATVQRDATHIATVKDITLTIDKQNASIGITNTSQYYDGTVKKVITSTFPSNLKVVVEYKSGATVVASPTDAGSYAVTATINETNYTGSQTATLTILKQDQAITNFPSQQTKAFGDQPFDLTAVAGSGLNVLYTSSNPSVATISGKTVTIVGAGSTTITASQPGDANTNAADPLQQTLDVLKANQTITFESIPVKTFGNTSFDLVASTTSGLPITFSSDDATVATVSGKTVTIVGAGSCNIFATPASNNNYFDAQDGQTLVVNKASATLALSNVTHFFDGSVKQATLTVTPTGLSGVTVTYKSGSTVISPPSAIGDYTVEASLTNANYGAPTVSSPFTISDKPAATINNFNDFSVTYGDPMFSLGASTNSTGALTYSEVAGGTGDITVNNNLITIVKAGTVTLRASVAGDANFGPATKDVTLTISKALLVATVDNKSRAYGDPEPTLTVQLSGFKNGEIASNVITTMPPLAVLFPVTSTTSPAQYQIDITDDVVADNYKIGSSVRGTFTITKAPLTIKADNKTRLYGNNNPVLTVSYTGFKNNETSATAGFGTPSITATATTTSDVGNYDIIPSGALSNNYSFTYQNGTLRVDKASLTVTAQNQTREYGNPNPELTLTYSGFKLAQTADVINVKPTLKTNTSIASGVGTYLNDIVLNTPGSDNNYDFTGFTAGNMTIEKALLTATVDDKSREYGEANPTFTMTLTGFRNGDDESVINGYPSIATLVPVSAISTPGNYVIAHTGDIVANNYRIGASTEGTLTITKALLLIYADDHTRLYGDANPAFAGTVAGLKNGESDEVIGTVSFSTSANLTSDAGEYDIVPSGAASDNYSFIYENGTLTVGKAPLTAKALNVERDYKQSNPAFRILYSGFKNDDDESVIDVAPSASTTATEDSNVGDYPITISGGSDNNYEFVYDANAVITVDKAFQTISFDPINDKNVADPEFALNGSASSELTITYTVSGPASLQNGNMVRLDGTEGVVTVKANQSGNENYLPADQVVITFNVTTKKSQTITFNALSSRRFDEGNFNLGAHANSSLAIAYSSSDNNIVEINGTQAVVKSAGTVTITAAQAGNDEYNAALSVSRQLVINKGQQTITFTLSQDHTLTENTLTLSGSSTSDLSIIYSSSNEEVATVEGNVVTFVGTGVTTITASQAGDARYEAAADVAQTLHIKQAQTITFSALASVTLGDAPVQLSAQSTSGLPVTYQSSNTQVATISNNTIVIVGAGETTITASQTGNDQYGAAADQAQHLIVNKKSQTITFGSIEEKIVEDDPFTLAATSSSGLAVTYTSSNTAVATINGNTVTITGDGETEITAMNEGNAEYNAAPSVTQKLTVKLITGVAEYDAEKSIAVYPNPANDYVVVEGKYFRGNLVMEVTDAKGMPVSGKVSSSPLSDQSFRVDVSGLSSGVYLMLIRNEHGVVMKRIVKR